MPKNKFIKANLNGIEIDVRSECALYITIGKWVVYLDDSTRERIITHWYDNKNASCSSKKQRKQTP